LRCEVQPAQTNVSTANLVVNSSSSIHTQLSAVHNNIDIGWYPNSAKAVKDDKKYNLFANSITTPRAQPALHFMTFHSMTPSCLFNRGTNFSQTDVDKVFFTTFPKIKTFQFSSRCRPNDQNRKKI